MQSERISAIALDRDLVATPVLLGFEVGNIQWSASARVPREDLTVPDLVYSSGRALFHT